MRVWVWRHKHAMANVECASPLSRAPPLWVEDESLREALVAAALLVPDSARQRRGGGGPAGLSGGGPCVVRRELVVSPPRAYRRYRERR